MAKIKDLSPKLPYSLPPAEMELAIPVLEGSMGERVGGLSMYSNVFKRGYGEAVFGSSEEGIWLGAADFEGAPFRVNMEGHMTAESADIAGAIDIGGADATSFHVDEDGNLWLGDAAFASAPFRVSSTGVMTLENDSGTTIIDGGGLVSSANFPFSSITGSGTQTTTSSSYQDISGVTLTFSLARSQQVFVSYIVRGGTSGVELTDTSPPLFQAILDVDGSDAGPVLNCYSMVWQNPVSSPSTVSNGSTIASHQLILSLGAGSHTIKLKFKSSDGSTTVTSFRESTVLTYFKMGA